MCAARFSRLDIEFLYPTLHLFHRRQIAPRTEGVDIRTDGMDDIVDTMLDNKIRSTSNIRFYRETCGTLETIGLISDAVVLSQNARATDSTAYDRGIGAESHLSHIVGPGLSRNRVAIADDSVILSRSPYVDGIEEVEPVSVTAQVKRQLVSLSIVTISIRTL